ncbi:hypothetical protein FTO74_11150 [Granulicella sp. WH15]|uniref:hypothetical protein n=1 Tax=Granulicella sp. WH15 TaxID=2602070 RepID=UPI001366DAEC|nr:hypothetical protein [Granulicella sp. WH15]QHN03865.1 hypothetical protein FTO74_11150 [Granulicella sp. WH15]
MTKQMKAAMAAMLMVGTLPMQAQTATTTKHVTAKKKRPVVTKKAPVESAITRELRELREKQAAQQAQIDALTNANAAKDAQLAAAQQSAQSAQTQAQAATAAAQSVNATVQANTDAVQALKTNVTDLQTTNTGLATTISANKTEILQQIESPTTIRYKGITITPVAFFALEGVYRQRSINSDINTPFNTTPFSGATDAHTSELNFSARQSRIGGLFEGTAANIRLSGYFETDFLSSGATSNNNQSNSYTLRVRQIWGKAETQSGFAVTGGQTWSLLTETGRSTDVRTEKLPNTIDPQYMVGYTWARQPGIRLQQRINGPMPGSALTFALALEQAQIIYSGTTNAPTNFEFGAPGQSGGLYNAFNGNYTNNVAPDVIAKIAADTKQVHFEVAGVARFFRARVYPGVASAATGVPATAGAAPYNDTKTGGGVEAGLRYNSKFVDVAGTFMYGQGISRYGSATLSDVTVHPNGTLEPIRSSHGMFSLETHPTKKFDVYAYYGGEYAQRTVYATGVAATPFTGYGSINTNDTGCSTEVAPTSSGFTGSVTPAGSCAGATRYIQEGMIGFTYKAVNSPRFGRLQYQATYSYLARTLWEGLTSGTYGSSSAQFGSPKATNGMVHVGMRYYIP